MPATYEPISTQTLETATNTVTFTGISQAYTDLVLVFNGSETGGSTPELRVGNGSIDTASNYSYTLLQGDGSSAASSRVANATSINPAFNPTTNSNYVAIYHFLNYSNTTTYKTILVRGNDTTGRVALCGALWRSTSAINQIRIFDDYNNMKIGTTLTLYGIKAA
jgi:hypothetical protein